MCQWLSLRKKNTMEVVLQGLETTRDVSSSQVAAATTLSHGGEVGQVDEIPREVGQVAVIPREVADPRMEAKVVVMGAVKVVRAAAMAVAKVATKVVVCPT